MPPPTCTAGAEAALAGSTMPAESAAVRDSAASLRKSFMFFLLPFLI